MKRAPRIAALLTAAAAGFMAPAFAGGPTILAPPSINIQPRGPVLDQKCVDRLKGAGAGTARAAHECRKAYSPGTPAPQALRDSHQTATPSPQP